MKLISCYIAHFGKIEDFSYEFEPGLNSIIKENGWGKTTFSVFLKAMFYGMDYSPNTRNKLLERNHYLPWNGSLCGGSLVFEVGNRLYKVERTFGKTNKEDTFKLFDQKTGFESTDYSEKLGEEIFKVDRDSFEKSIYIPQTMLSTGMTDSLNAKMGNLSSAKHDIADFDNAVSTVKNAKSEYVKNSKANPGKLNVVRQELKLAREEVEKYPAIIEAYEGQVQIIEDKTDRLTDLLEQKSVFVDKIQLQSKKEQEYGAYKIHKENLSKERERFAEYDDFFAAGIPSENELEKLEQLDRDLAVHEAALDNINLDGRGVKLIKTFSERIPTEADFDCWNALATKLSELRAKAQQARLSEEGQQQLEELKFFFSKLVPTEEQLGEIEKKATAIVGLDGRISQANERVISLKAQAKVQDKKRSQEKGNLGIILALVLFVALIFGGIIFGLFAEGVSSYVVAGVCFVLAIVDIIIYFVRAKMKKSNASKELEAEADEIRTAEDELSGYIDKRQAIEAECSEFLGYFLLTRADTMQENVYEIRRKLDQYNHLLEEQNSLHKNMADTLDELADVQLELNTQLQPFTSEYGADLFEEGGELAFISQLKADSDIYQKYMLSQQEMASHENVMRDITQSISKILTKYPVEENATSTEKIKEIRVKVQQYDEIIERVQELEENIAEFEKNNSIDESVESVDDLQNQQIMIDEQIVALNKQILQEKENLTRTTDEIERLSDLSENIDRLEIQEKEYRQKVELLSDTLDLLTKARESFLEKYMEPLQRGLRKYIGLIDVPGASEAAADISAYEIDMDLNIKLEYQGSTKGSDFLSKGYQDMVAFCSRLALIDVLYTDEKPLLVLDDPFMNLDEKKIAESLGLLDKISGERQIIYFTCHESRI